MSALASSTDQADWRGKGSDVSTMSRTPDSALRSSSSSVKNALLANGTQGGQPRARHTAESAPRYSRVGVVADLDELDPELVRRRPDLIQALSHFHDAFLDLVAVVCPAVGDDEQDQGFDPLPRRLGVLDLLDVGTEYLV